MILFLRRLQLTFWTDKRCASSWLQMSDGSLFYVELVVMPVLHVRPSGLFTVHLFTQSLDLFRAWNKPRALIQTIYTCIYGKQETWRGQNNRAFPFLLWLAPRGTYILLMKKNIEYICEIYPLSEVDIPQHILQKNKENKSSVEHQRTVLYLNFFPLTPCSFFCMCVWVHPEWVRWLAQGAGMALSLLACFSNGFS